MYVNCGKIGEAQGVFDRVAARDEVAWTILIAGYAQIGESEHTFRLFNRMRAECGQPNLMTFVGVLAACSHSGRVDEGVRYFMAISYPSIEHFCCLLDIVGRAGQMDEVLVTVNKMPFLPTPSVWHTVLSACKNWGNLELARAVFRFIVQIDAKDVTAFVSMSNIYTCACTSEDVHPSGL
jgi:pentatricopeptide repeat protein